MKGTGWLVLCLLFLGLISAGKLWFIIVVGALVWWLVKVNNESGSNVNPMEAIARIFTDK